MSFAAPPRLAGSPPLLLANEDEVEFAALVESAIKRLPTPYLRGKAIATATVFLGVLSHLHVAEAYLMLDVLTHDMSDVVCMKTVCEGAGMPIELLDALRKELSQHERLNSYTSSGDEVSAPEGEPSGADAACAAGGAECSKPQQGYGFSSSLLSAPRSHPPV